jgi:transposase
MRGLHCESSNYNAEPQAERNRFHEKGTIFGVGCPCRDDCGSVAEPDGEVRSLGIIPNREESIRKLVKKLGPAEQLQVCYEAGPTG